MTAFENAGKFFAACEAPEGWAGCAKHAADNATFSAQSEPLAEMNTLEEYCEWMLGLGTVIAPGASYTLHASSYDEPSRTALFFATFHGTHTGEGGPVPPTGQSTNSEYVYAVRMNADNKVEHLTKIWNAPWALRELGWAD